jgi:hypothetical protein
LRHDWAVGRLDDAAACALTDPVDLAPLGEGQNLVVIE